MNEEEREVAIYIIEKQYYQNVNEDEENAQNTCVKFHITCFISGYLALLRL